MFVRIASSALFAGAVAGLVTAVLQYYLVQPLLLHAELFEGGDLSHFNADGIGSSAVFVNAEGIDWLRSGLTVGFLILFSCGFGLILAAAMASARLFYGQEITVHKGLVWGLAGFLCFQMAPGFSLAPEVPGVAAGDLGSRQLWTVFTIAATGIGLWLIAFHRNIWLWLLAIGLVLVPHIIGAPHPPEFEGVAPPELSALFVARSLGTGIFSWALLGTLVAFFWDRLGAGTPQGVKA